MRDYSIDLWGLDCVGGFSVEPGHESVVAGNSTLMVIVGWTWGGAWASKHWQTSLAVSCGFCSAALWFRFLVFCCKLKHGSLTNSESILLFVRTESQWDLFCVVVSLLFSPHSSELLAPLYARWLKATDVFVWWEKSEVHQEQLWILFWPDPSLYGMVVKKLLPFVSHATSADLLHCCLHLWYYWLKGDVLDVDRCNFPSLDALDNKNWHF